MSSEDDLSRAMDDAQQPARSYGPFAGMHPIGAAPGPSGRVKAPDPAMYFCDIFTIHCPPKSCRQCRGSSNEEGDEEGGEMPPAVVVDGRGVLGTDAPNYERCPHHERAAYMAKVNQIHSLGHKLLSRRVETLKDGSIQVFVEWIETKKKTGE